MPIEAQSIEIELTWGDYLAEPPLSAAVLEGNDSAQPDVEWVRRARKVRMPIPVPPSGEFHRHLVPESSPIGVPGGGALEVSIQCRRMKLTPPGGQKVEQNVVSVFATNKRRWVARRYGDLTFAFQVELALHCEAGFCPQHDLSRYNASDPDDRLAEGVFLTFDNSRIADWLTKSGVHAREETLRKGFNKWSERRFQGRPKAPDFPGSAYYMLHAFSHSLMSEMALECGYPTTALKERIYALPGVQRP